MEVVKCEVLLARDYVLILFNATAHDRGHKKNCSYLIITSTEMPRTLNQL